MNLKLKFKFTKPQFKLFEFERLLRYIPVTTLILLLVTTAGSVIFLYQYFYQTIAQAKEVLILKNQVSLHQVNLPLYQKVFDAWQNKKTFDANVLEGLPNPFAPLATPTTSGKNENQPGNPSPSFAP